MSKIEEFKAAQAVAKNIAAAISHTLGRDSVNNDKHTFRVQFVGLVTTDWAPMNFHIETAYGYYGSSSSYSSSSNALGEYLAKAIKRHAATLLDCAAAMAAEDAERARKAAEDEAKQVLKGIKS